MLRDLFSLFPAHAGVILIDTELINVLETFPRTCGGDPYSYAANNLIDNFSPHMRG